MTTPHALTQSPQALPDAPVDVATLSLEKARVMLELMLALGGDGLQRQLSAPALEGNLCSLFDLLHDIGEAVAAMHTENARELAKPLATPLQAQGGAA